MGIAITCSFCGVRFTEDQIIVKVDCSKSNKYYDCDIAYYCNGHEPKGVENISAKARTFQKQIEPSTKICAEFKRGNCKICGATFVYKTNTRRYCSKSCASKAQKNRKKGKNIILRKANGTK